MKQTPRPILMVSSEFPPMPGGIGNHAYNLCKYLVKRGYRVTVLSNRRSDSEEQYREFIADNRELKMTLLPRSANPVLTYWTRIKAYRAMVKQDDFDVVFSGKFSIWLAALHWHRNKAWAIIHGSEIKQGGIRRWLFQRGLDAMTNIISVSTFTETLLLNAYPKIQHQKHVVINNGFSLKDHPLQLKQIQAGECHLITVGGMHQRKGQHNIIAALPEIKKQFPGVIYTIAGLPGNMADLQALAVRLNVTAHVRFVVKPDNEALLQLFKEAHVFAMLSENLPNGDIEGFGIAILEGMSMGLPAIGSANTGIRDAIKQGYSGVLINDIHDAGEITQAIAQIMKNHVRFAEQAKNWSAQFTWDNVIDQYIDVISNS